MSSEIAISVRNVSKSYKLFRQPSDRLKQLLYSSVGMKKASRRFYEDMWAVRDVSFDVPRGSTFGIVGRNGAGKSTLLQLICGVLPPSSGEIEIGGRITALLELAAGFNPEFTGRENARFNAALFGLSASEIERKIEEIEAFAEIGQFFDQPVKTYSSGMYVRVGFAVQACIDPDVLIVDEALAVGDARFQAKCMARIKALKERGTSILFVSHDVNSVRALCDQALWLDRGLPRMLGDVGSVTSAYVEYLLAADETPAPQDDPSEGAFDQPKSDAVDPIADPPPVHHWGSRQGIVRAVRLENEAGHNKRLFRSGEKARVRISVDIPQDIDLVTLGVAFSVKSLRGEDLFVGTSWHNERVNFLKIGSKFDIAFEFNMWLNTNEYIISVAVERRIPNELPEYYEYIDGSLIFSVIDNQHQFGSFLIPIERSVTVPENV